MKMTLRALHRWTGLVSAIFFMGIAVTAFALQADLWISGKAPPGQEQPGPPPPTLPSDAQMQHYMENAILAARRDNSVTAARTLTLTFGPNPTASFDQGGKKIDVTTGQFLPAPPQKKDWHLILQDIHAGYFLGQFGRILSCLLAICLFMLSYTGLRVYIDMFKRRRKMGRKSLFWK